MDWVKRNMGFVVGAAVSAVLLVLSGFYLYSNSKKNNEAKTQLEAEYSELQRLSNLKPHPGKGRVDNIKLAREQKEALMGVVDRVRTTFQPIPAIPSSESVSGEEFSAALRRTLDYLDRLAENTSVMLPPNYSFSFEAEKRLVKFAPGSLDRLAVQLGEVKVISEILFEAKVNKLTGLRRERISADDFKGPQTDYLARNSITNDLAIISPYAISFESFSAELAEVMTGFANSPHGIVIKEVDVNPASSVAGSTSPYSPYGRGELEERAIYTPAQPVYTPQPAAEAYRPAFNPEFEGGRGYGGGGGTAIRQPTFTRPTFDTAGGGGNPYGANQPTYTQPGGRYANPYGQATQPAYQPYGSTTTPGGIPGTSQTLIDEQPLSVTILVEVIKLLPPEQE